MERNFHQRLGDYFDSWELVELLQLTIDDIIYYFSDEIDDAEEDLEEIMRYGR